MCLRLYVRGMFSYKSRISFSFFLSFFFFFFFSLSPPGSPQIHTLSFFSFAFNFFKFISFYRSSGKDIGDPSAPTFDNEGNLVLEYVTGGTGSCDATTTHVNLVCGDILDSVRNIRAYSLLIFKSMALFSNEFLPFTLSYLLSESCVNIAL